MIFLDKLISSIITMLIFIFVYIIINQIIRRMIRYRFSKKTEKRRKTLLILINNVIKYVLMIMAILTILSIYGINTSTLIASVGLVGLGVSLAMQDTLKDFLAGIFIIFEEQYDVGDTIEIDGFKGEVVSLGLKTTKIRAYTGEINIVANRNIQSIINYSSSNSLAIVDFILPHEITMEQVEDIIEPLCKKMTKSLKKLKGEVTFIGIQSFEENGTKYRITAETLPMEHFEIERAIRKKVKLELQKNEILNSYSQVVMHNA